MRTLSIITFITSLFGLLFSYSAWHRTVDIEYVLADTVIPMSYGLSRDNSAYGWTLKARSLPN